MILLDLPVLVYSEERETKLRPREKILYTILLVTSFSVIVIV